MPLNALLRHHAGERRTLPADNFRLVQGIQALLLIGMAAAGVGCGVSDPVEVDHAASQPTSGPVNPREIVERALAESRITADEAEMIDEAQDIVEHQEIPDGRPETFRGEFILAMDLSAVRSPRLWDADQVHIPGILETIGVIIDRQPRAYLLQAMKIIPDHVINDLVGRVPVSVTYCDVSNCTRVLTGNAQHEPINLRVGGFIGGRTNELALVLDGKRYRHTSEEVPLEDFEYERLPWEDWVELHPDTQVFLGRLSDVYATNEAAPEEPLDAN